MKDERGNRYGSLIVLAQADDRERSNRCIKWICQCTCGNTKVMNGNNLRFGRSTSCGECDRQEGKEL